MIALVIDLASVAVLAIRASQQAAYQRDIRDIAVSELLLSESHTVRDSSPTLSRLLSIAAWRVDPSNQARYAMLAPVALPGNAAALTRHAGPVFSVVFSPNGKTLAAGNADGAVRLWNVAYLVDFVARLCALVGWSLTRAEWARYIPLTAYHKVCP